MIYPIGKDYKFRFTASEFKKALMLGKALDENGLEHNFFTERKGETIIVISQVEVTEEVSIRARTFDWPIVLFQCKIKSLALIVYKLKSLFLPHVIIDEAIYLSAIEFEDSFKTRRCSFGDSNHIRRVKCKDLILSGIDTAFGINISESKIHGELHIGSFCEIKGETYLKDSIINEVSVTGWDNCGKLTLEGIKFQKLNWKGVINNSHIWCNNINKLEEGSEISIVNSSMGNWDLINCDFRKCSMMIYSSKIVGMFYTNTQFPTTLSIFQLEDKTTLESAILHHGILRDGYNQLKTVAQKLSDKKNFLLFQKAELDSFYNSIEWQDDPFTKFQLLSMKWSNSYGTNWSRGVVFVLCTNLLFFAVINFQRPIDFSRFDTFLSDYFTLLFSITTKPVIYSTPWEVSWFWLSRIFIAFGIYQTVTAFRKFGKSD